MALSTSGRMGRRQASPVPGTAPPPWRQWRPMQGLPSLICLRCAGGIPRG